MIIHDRIRELPDRAAHPLVLEILTLLLERIDLMALDLSKLQAAVTAAVAEIDAGSSGSQFTQATQDAAVAAQKTADDTAQASVDAANQTEVDAMTSALTGAAPAA